MSRLKIKDSNEEIEVQNVYCIGKNYVDHIRELDNKNAKSELPKEPVVFLKSNTSVSVNATSVSIPQIDGRYISDDLQNEVELVIIIWKDGIAIPKDEAFIHVLGYSVGIDFTLRDVQSEFKKKGLPWTLSKGFIGSAPVSEIVRKEFVNNPEDIQISLSINGDIKQNENTSKMIFKIPDLIHYISSIFGLKRGDIIFTGTPAGVTKLKAGDRIRASLESVGELNIIVS